MDVLDDLDVATDVATSVSPLAVADEPAHSRWYHLRGTGLGRVLPADEVSVEVIRQLV